MKVSSSSKRTAWVVATLALAALAQTAPAQSRSSNAVEGFTEPSQYLKLAVYSPGIVREILVKEGEQVKAGQPILQQDDRIEQKTLESLKGEAFSGLNVKASLADLQLKKDKLHNLTRAYNNDRAATEFEVEEAKADKAIAEVRVELARQEMETKKAEYDRQALRIELMKLTSPVNGRIQKLWVGVGEMAQPENGNTRAPVEVVVLDPLYVKVVLPQSQSQQLKVGDKLDVSHDGGKTWDTANVGFIPPYASGGAGTQTVRLDLPNPKNRDAGQKVLVKLPDNIAAAAPSAQTASSK